jgi:hypothetical protein
MKANPLFLFTVPAMRASRCSLLFGLALSLGMGSQVAMAGCSGAARQALQQSYNTASQADQAPTILSNMISNPPPGTDGASGGVSLCSSQSWPVSLPGVGSLLSGVATQVINQACSAARAKVSQATGPYLSDINNTLGHIQTPGGSISTGVPNINTGTLTSGGSSALGGLFGGGTP